MHMLGIRKGWFHRGSRRRAMDDLDAVTACSRIFIDLKNDSVIAVLKNLSRAAVQNHDRIVQGPCMVEPCASGIDIDFVSGVYGHRKGLAESTDNTITNDAVEHTGHCHRIVFPIAVLRVVEPISKCHAQSLLSIKLL